MCPLFTRNEGAGDRVVRVLLGIALLMLAFVGPRTPWGYVGLLPLVTGLLGFCPLYSVLRLSTARQQQG